MWIRGEGKQRNTHLGLKSSDRICLMTCLRGHSSSIYNLAIKAFFFSHTSDEMEVFMVVNRRQNRNGLPWEVIERGEEEGETVVVISRKEEGKKIRGGAISTRPTNSSDCVNIVPEGLDPLDNLPWRRVCH